MAGGVHVLFVNPGVALGGAEHSLLLLLEGLRTRGIATTVALFGNGPFRDRLQTRGFSTVTLQPPRLIRRVSRYRSAHTPWHAAALALAGAPTVVRLAALARHTQSDLIHTNGLKAHLLGGLAGRLSRTPVVWHLRDFPPAGTAGWALRLAARTLPAVVLANSRSVAAAIADRDGRVDVRTVYNAVDLRRFRPNQSGAPLRRELGIAEDVPVVGLVAHLTPWKGHDLFLTIARHVLARVPDASFVIAGGAIYETDGHVGYEDALRSRAVELGIADRVVFLGAREDVAEILTVLDVLVHCPTAPEPFGRVLAEAMAVGRPVVASRFGGIPEVVVDGVTGILVGPGDATAFAAAVVQLLEDASLRQRFGQAARARAEATFPIDAHVARVLEAYEAATGSARVAA